MDTNFKEPTKAPQPTRKQLNSLKAAEVLLNEKLPENELMDKQVTAINTDVLADKVLFVYRDFVCLCFV